MNAVFKERARRTGVVVAICLALAVLAVGCDQGGDDDDDDVDFSGYLFMTDTYSGSVYTYDTGTRTASSASLASTAANGTGEIAFYDGIGYACVGSGDDAGLYSFDPAATSPSFTKIGDTVTAQYLAFYSATKAYVSTYGAGIYSFDPSSPSSGLSALVATAGLTIQEIVISGDYLYAADNGNGAILKIAIADGSLAATIQTNADGSTGLVAGTYNGAAGVFAANTGGYETVKPYSALPGSIDFVAATAADGATATLVAASVGNDAIYPARIVQLVDGKLVATGYGHTYCLTLVGASATAVELLDADSASFGSLDIAYDEGAGLLYVPSGDYSTYASLLYIFDESGKQAANSPVTIMVTGTTVVANIGFFED